MRASLLPGQPTTHLLYLHGFRSSPQSAKAQLLAARMAQRHPQVHWWCPQLPPSPAQAGALLLAGTADWPAEQMAVVGSSLGGFYARWLGLQRRCRAVLLNPAAFPARDLARHLGEQTVWQRPSERFYFQPHFIDELNQMQLDVQRLAALQPTQPDRLLAIVAEGDELLDFREMLAFARGGTTQLLAGSDHALSDFATHLDTVLTFVGL